MRSIEDAEIKLRKVEARKKRILDEETYCQKELAIAKDESTRISQTLKSATSKVEPFLHCSVMDASI